MISKNWTPLVNFNGREIFDVDNVLLSINEADGIAARRGRQVAMRMITIAERDELIARKIGLPFFSHADVPSVEEFEHGIDRHHKIENAVAVREQAEQLKAFHHHRIDTYITGALPIDLPISCR